MINVGIVGLGFMAATHIRAYRQVSNARVAALCNPSGRHLDGDFSGVAGNVGATDPVILDMAGVKATRRFEDLLEDPKISLIDVCAPTLGHHDLVIAALKAGKHVLCEKPLARTAKQARRMVAAAEVSTGFLMPAMCLRFWPEWLWLQNELKQKSFGRVLSARFRRVAEPPGWGNFLNGEKSGGALLDLHIHDVDFVQYCFGRPLAVYATGYTKLSGAIDHVVAQYKVESGAIVQAEGTWAMTPGFGFNMSYTVNCEQATIDYDISRGADALKLFVAGQPPKTITCDGGDGYIGELRHMITAIEQGQRPNIVTPKDGLSAVEICEAEERSIATGRIVRLVE